MHRVLLTLFLFFISGKNSLACKLKTPFANARIRKSCVALKSQANAVTFIFLSGIVLSQSLIVAYTFMNSTAPNMSFSDGMSTPTGFAVGVPEQSEDSLAIPEELNEPASSDLVLEEVPEPVGDNSESPEVDSSPTDDSEPVDDMQQPASDEQAETPVAEEGTPDAADSEDAEPLQENPAPESEDDSAESPLIPSEQQANESQENPAPEPSPHIDNSTPESLPDSIAVLDENESSEIQLPVLPEPLNETQDMNETIDDSNNTTTSPEPPAENNSSDDDLPDVTIPVLEEATLEASLVFPSDIKRGDTFTLVVRLTNTGSAPANSVVVELEMPAGAIATEASIAIDSLAVGESSEVEFTIQLSYETLLGENEIKVRATYE